VFYLKNKQKQNKNPAFNQKVWLNLILTQDLKNLSGKPTWYVKEKQAAANDSLVESKLHTYTSCLMTIKPKFCFSKIGFKIYQRNHRYPLTIQTLNSKVQGYSKSQTWQYK
jgi:hypothetical protein